MSRKDLTAAQRRAQDRLDKRKPAKKEKSNDATSLARAARRAELNAMTPEERKAAVDLSRKLNAKLANYALAEKRAKECEAIEQGEMPKERYCISAKRTDFHQVRLVGGPPPVRFKWWGETA